MKIDFVEAEIGKKPSEQIQKNLSNGDILTILNYPKEKIVIVCLNGEVVYRSDQLLVKRSKENFLDGEIENIKIKGIPN